MNEHSRLVEKVTDLLFTSAHPERGTRSAHGRRGREGRAGDLIVLASDESSFSTGAELIADGGEAGRSRGEPAKPKKRRNKMIDRGEPKLKVLVFAAALRAGSLNRKLAAAAARIAEESGAVVDHASMKDFDVPSYDGDAETATGFPKGAEELRRRLIACDAFIISSPEYNASMPGVLKNLIDWVSRFQPQPFDGKHGLLLSASPSMAGGNPGLWALRVPLEHLGARIYPDMFSLAQAHTALVDVLIADAALRARFDKNLRAFLSLAEAAKHYPCMKRAWVEFLGEPPSAAERVDPVPP